MGLLFVWKQPIYAQESSGFEKLADVLPDEKFAVRIMRRRIESNKSFINAIQPAAAARIRNGNMKRIIPASTTWIWAITAFVVFPNAPHGFAKPQKKPAGSAQENADPLVNAAMKNMETGVWSAVGAAASS